MWEKFLEFARDDIGPIKSVLEILHVSKGLVITQWSLQMNRARQYYLSFLSDQKAYCSLSYYPGFVCNILF